MKADNDTRSAWSEFVNTGKGNLTQAIRDPEVRLLALEAWNAVSMGPAPARTRPAADDDLDGNKKRKLDDNGTSGVSSSACPLRHPRQVPAREGLPGQVG